MRGQLNFYPSTVTRRMDDGRWGIVGNVPEEGRSGYTGLRASSTPRSPFLR
jgi:hypothetical protein